MSWVFLSKVTSYPDAPYAVRLMYSAVITSDDPLDVVLKVEKEIQNTDEVSGLDSNVATQVYRLNKIHHPLPVDKWGRDSK